MSGLRSAARHLRRCAFSLPTLFFRVSRRRAAGHTPPLADADVACCFQPREQELLEELDEKEQQLRVAAQLGQSLVARTEELQERHDFLAHSAALTSTGMEESDYRIREVTAENRRLHGEYCCRPSNRKSMFRDRDCLRKNDEFHTKNGGFHTEHGGVFVLQSCWRSGRPR